MLLLTTTAVGLKVNFVWGKRQRHMTNKSTESLSDETINREPMCIGTQKDHVCTLKILLSMLEFGGLWKHQNNPACIKSVRVFVLKVDTIQKRWPPLSDLSFNLKPLLHVVEISKALLHSSGAV